jgi:hypothetical protein
MNHFPETNLPPSEVFSLARARIGTALGAAILGSDPLRGAAQSEQGGPEQDDDGPETWTGLPV